LEHSIQLSAPDIGDAERQAVAEVLATSVLSIGCRVVGFEQAIAAYVGARNAIAVSSGTAALHLGMVAAGVECGDAVITSPFSFIASANVVLYQRALPVFVDIDSDTLNLDVEQVARAADDLAGSWSTKRAWLPPSERGKARRNFGKLAALLPVDVFGQPAELRSIARVAIAHGVPVVEDACEAVGAEYHGVRIGASSASWAHEKVRHATCFSFYPNKQMTTGEGGMIVTDDDNWSDLCRSLRNQGRDTVGTWLDHTRIGFNYRMDELSAALGLVQTRRLDELLARRERVAAMYEKCLAGVDGVTCPRASSATTRRSWFVYVVRMDDHIDRDRLIERLGGRGIPTRPYFQPIHLQPAYRERFGYQEGMFPKAEAAGRQLLALPFSGRMIEEQVETVCTHLRSELELA